MLEELTEEQKDQALEIKYGFPMDLRRPKNVKNHVIAWRIGANDFLISKFFLEFSRRLNL